MEGARMYATITSALVDKIHNQQAQLDAQEDLLNVLREEKAVSNEDESLVVEMFGDAIGDVLKLLSLQRHIERVEEACLILEEAMNAAGFQ